MSILTQPWSWWAAGIIIGLIVPILLIIGNKHFGLSANLRHTCAACYPANIQFFKYEWKKETWNMFFAGGILVGALIAATLLADPEPVKVAPALAQDLQSYGISDYSNMVPNDIYSWESLFTLRGFVLLVFGGFLVGFGSRYAGGCTSGHSIMGLSNLQIPSLIVTIFFMIGGIIMSNFLLPFIMAL
ncbi:MAG: YeeE/YedE thiosulfate transporter family protein [Saprospiraceae bacterium]|nr:YeeE/YedE family protein [Saprospiraceae bacterium]MCB9342621.1 YeeE/YedE family protein [Lewinellaceae bacterium]